MGVTERLAVGDVRMLLVGRKICFGVLGESFWWDSENAFLATREFGERMVVLYWDYTYQCLMSFAFGHQINLLS